MMTSVMYELLRVPRLPAEIWKIVFANFDTADEDLVQVWLSYRHVSKLFKEEAEHVFGKDVISKTSMWISNGDCLQYYANR